MVEDAVKTIYGFFDSIRGYETFDVNEVACCISILYCRHKGYPYDFSYLSERTVEINYLGETSLSDKTLSLLKARIKSKKFSLSVVKFSDAVKSIPEEDFSETYSSLVDYYYDRISYWLGGADSVYYIQPREVTQLITFFLKENGVTSVYNPFAGLCSYPIALGPTCKFFAQEINETTVALARVRVDAYGLNPDSIELGDSARQWNDHGAEAIVASVPFGLTFRGEERKLLGIPCQNYDEFFFYKALDIKQESLHFPKKCIATIVARSFCYRNSSKTVREHLCKGRCIDTVIELPEGIFPGTSIATSIVILTEEKPKDSVRFVDATPFFVAEKKRNRLWMENVERILAALKDDSSDFIKHVSFADISEQNYILCSDNYLSDTFECGPGKQVVRLGDIAWTSVNFPAVVQSEVVVLDESGLSNKVLDILHPDTGCLSTTQSKDGYYQTGPCLIFAQKEGEVKVYNYKDERPILMKMRYLPLHVKEGISPEYLALTLLKDPIFCRQFKQRSGMSLIPSIILNRNIVIDVPSLQEQQLRLAEQEEKDLMNRTRAAEDARYQIGKAGSDIAHMLGATFKKQNEIISQFRYLEPGSDKYQSYVTSLIDTAQYVNRVITSVGKDLAKAKITLRKTDISSEVEDYIRAWGNFNGTTDFTLITQDLTNHDVAVKMDTLLFRILMDTLIDNAWRHGFDQGNYQSEDGNMIAIRLSPVLVDDKPYLCLSVMNNGHPLDDHYSVRDYIERGNFKGDSGRTGLGGNHVYTIAKRHNGFFALNSEQDWNFVADVLLPVETPGQTPFNTEYDGEYV